MTDALIEEYMKVNNNEITDLKERISNLEAIVQTVHDGLEKAKENPMVANMLKMVGM